MKNFAITVLSFFLYLPTFLNAQEFELYTPPNYTAALENNTRTLHGNPGQNYWVNHTDYDMNVEVDPETGVITGSAKMTYFNNSPDTLSDLVFRLYQNIYKVGNSRQFNIGNVDLTEGVEISNLVIDKTEYPMASGQIKFSATNMYVNLDNPIMPLSRTSVEVSWSFTMPQKRWIRFGQYSKQHLMVAYWYPQIAVYDDIDGWDKVEYAGMVEFYNDLNNFDVSISIPSRFVVWGTGELQNPDKVFQKKIVKRIEQAKNSFELVRVITQEDYANAEVCLSNTLSTWKFSAKNVPDFAFAASTGSNWDAVSLVVDKTSQRKVLISSVYPDSAVHYEDVALIARDAVEYMSFELPGIPFPFPQATVFANGRKTGGMEFPMIANDGAPDDYADLQGLTYHEVFHNYFPFFMGTNERKYAFMDEGWARYFPKGFLEKCAPQDNYFQRTIAQYESFAGSENELPPMIPTYIFNDYETQRMAAYTRPAVAYYLLHQLLGDEVFKKALKEYMELWAGKHPMPFDFFNTFDLVASEDLSWFWKPWFFDRGYPDLAIRELTDDNMLVIEKKGLLPVPLEILLIFEDGSEEKISQSARVWRGGETILEIPLPSEKLIKKIFLGNDLIPDTNREDNIWMAQ